MRATTARRSSGRFSHQAGHASKQLADSVLHALHGEQGAPANPPPRLVERTQRLRARLLVAEDNALNRRVAAELLSSEARGLADGGLAGRSAGAGGERAVRRGADGHADGYRWSRGDRESAPTGASPGCRSRHDRQRLAGRPAGRLAAGGERPCGEADRQGAAPGGLPGLSRQERRRARRQRQRTRANWSRRAITVGRFWRSLELIVRVAALRSGHAGPLRPARTPGEVRVQRRDLHTIAGQCQQRRHGPLVVPASWRTSRADPRRGRKPRR